MNDQLEPDVLSVMQKLLQTPFPERPAPPQTDYSWEFYQAFLADAPERLVSILFADYHDPEQCDPGDQAPDPIVEELRYRKRLKKAVEVLTASFGAPRTNLDTGEFAFGEELFNFDAFEFFWWKRGDRIAIIHFAISFGDGDFQLSLCVCAIPARSL